MTLNRNAARLDCLAAGVVNSGHGPQLTVRTEVRWLTEDFEQIITRARDSEREARATFPAHWRDVLAQCEQRRVSRAIWRGTFVNGDVGADGVVDGDLVAMLREAHDYPTAERVYLMDTYGGCA